LSKISLPVVLNEPLSILQRLSEELEYSELLDTANSLQDPFDRMVYVAAFIISGYSSSHYRNGCKNFNPLLGETFELIRPDKGWKYISEQVSHHPPISTTHCQSKSFIHEQVFHAKIKFWGKSMEVHPNGYTRLTLPKFNETYQWNKIVMYIYNIMSKERRIEHCGEITVRSTNGVSCTITFPKSGYDRQKNEFFGDIIYENVVKRRVFGQWHEYFSYGQENTAKTIWRMSSTPEDASLYYGFTRFAIELNEITDDIRAQLPPTDSRYRPDQRHLEEGRVELAEQEKQRIEEMQRTRRRLMESRNEHHKPLWFNKIDDEINEYESNGLYWFKREQPGFAQFKDQFVELW
jgi:oxysterol-binding protein-related protein 3/6/7